MKINPKPCKGTSKALGHGCKTPTTWRKYGLCMDCYKTWLLTTDNGAAHIVKNTLRASKQLKKAKDKETREWKEANKSIAEVKQDTRKVFQQWIRVRDSNLRCICCGTESESYDGGHYKKAELYSGVIFHPLNVNKQSVYCNQWLNGNEAEYRIGLVKKYGTEAVEELERLAIETKGKKWIREELIEIKEKYKLKLKNNDFNN